MNAGKHTPGPWTVIEGKTLLHIETANLGDGKPCGMPVCSIPKKRKADADLITASVELYEAAKDFVGSVHAHGDGVWIDEESPIYRKMVAAIAKAEGRIP